MKRTLIESTSRHAASRCLLLDAARAAALCVALALSACGGGGGDGDAGGGSADPAPTAPGDGGSSNPPPATPGGTALTGRLWHNNYAIDIRDGTQVASFDALPVYVTPNKYAIPWPDGTQYVTTEWDVVDDTTAVEIDDLASQKPHGAVTVQGYFRSPQPSPVDKKVVMGLLGEGTTGPADFVVVDIGAATVLASWPASEAAAAWLPDGRVLRASDDGRLRIATLGGAEEDAGKLALPADASLEAVWVDRQGRRLAARVRRPGDVLDQVDLWVANIDGGHAVAFTATGITSYARWSPDGRYIAFDVDTGSVCDSGGCIGSCGLWYAPADSRDLHAYSPPAEQDSLAFTVRNENGDDETLGCNLLAWTE